MTSVRRPPVAARAASSKSALFVVVLAGGRGTRFWPRSRRARPKQFLSIGLGRSLLQATVDRISPLVPIDRILVVTTRDLAALVRRDLPSLPRRNIVVEPVGRNTAPAIGLAALEALRRDANPTLVVMPSDHHVRKPATFRRALSAGVRFIASEPGALLTLGIPPLRPESGYGYIVVQPSRGKRAGAADLTPRAVTRFVEKPKRARAEALLRSGGVYWNSGVFLWRARTYLDALARHAPRIASGLERMRGPARTRTSARGEARLYARLPSISADYAVLERSRRVFVIPLDAGWSDVGSWLALTDFAATDPSGNVIEGRHVGIDTRRSILLSPSKLIATIGIEDLIVVDTGDTLFLCKAHRAQDVRTLVTLLERKGLSSHT